jgi:hypothetical protein
VILYTKYTGRCQDDFDGHACIKVMALHSTTDPATRTIHTMPTHMSDYPGLLKNFTKGSSGPDSSETLEEYRGAFVAMGGKVICTPLCIFPQGFSI